MFVPFKAINKNYFYDANQNDIIEISESDYKSLLNYYNKKADYKDLHILEKYQKMNYCKVSSIKRINHPYTDTLEDITKNYFSSLTLQVTQNCNLFCSYCAYSGNYINRIHTNRKMVFEIAKKSIDLLMKNSSKLNQVSVGFYGGEPLLEFELIKRCVEYIKVKYPLKKVSYTLTTNGTIYNDEILQFYIENDFNILISLDGPKEIHNTNRIFANGEGSFDRVISFINFIKKKYYKFIKNISLNAVIPANINIKKVYEFLEILYDYGIGVMVSDLNPNYNKDSLPMESDEHYSYIAEQNLKFSLQISGKIHNKTNKIFWNNKIGRMKIFFDLINNKSKLENEAHPGGPCLPMIDRFFVDVEGIIYPCERLSEKSEVVKIGNVSSSIDYNQIKNIINVGKSTEEECKNCWNIRFCNQCVAFCDDLKNISRKMRLNNCVSSRNNTLNLLREFCFLRENRYDFFDYKIKGSV